MSSTKPLINRNENDYILHYLKIVAYNGAEYDFQSHFIEFSYEESIFETGLHGSIFVKDSVDYPTLLPMIGEERIKASFTRLDETKTDGTELPALKFDLPVYQMDGKRQVGNSKKRQNYTLCYGSEIAFKNLNTVVCKRYKNMPYSDMVKDICKTYLGYDEKKIDIEPTMYPMDYIVQNLTPLSAIRKLSQRSTSASMESKGSSIDSSAGKNGHLYVFFEDRDMVHYATLPYLIKQPADKKITILYKPKNIGFEGEGLGAKTRPIEEDLYNVQYLHKDDGFDVIKSAASGEGTSSLLTVDPIRRKSKVRAMDLRGSGEIKDGGVEPLPNSTWEDFSHMQTGKPWTDKNKMFTNPMVNMNMVVGDSGQENHPYISSRDSSILPYFPEGFLNQRQSQKMQFLKHIVMVELSGDPRVKAGSVINFKYPEHMGKLGKHAPEEMDRYMQGDYLVVSVAHVVKNARYTMTLELIKDSVFADIKHRDPVKEYENIF